MASKSVQTRQTSQPAPTDGPVLPVLAFEDIANDDAPALVARGASYVTEFGNVEHRPETLTRSLAVVLIALRRLHDDWPGRSHAYRQDAGEIYRRANIGEDARGRLQQSVRWHVGNYLRDQLPPEVLAQYGLKQLSPLERLQSSRASSAALLTAARMEQTGKPKAKKTSAAKQSKTAAGASSQATFEPEESEASSTVRVTADHLRLASAAVKVLQQLSPDVIDTDLTVGQSAKLDEHLEEIQELVRALRRHTKKRRSAN